MLHNTKRHPSGYTLLELTLSLALLSLIMAGLGSAALFASKAIPDENSTTQALMRDTRVLNEVKENLELAKYVIEQQANAITVIVDDRTDDGIPDQLRYAWSGKAGDPLTFALNGGDESILLSSIDTFSIGYLTSTVSGVLPQHREAYGSAEQVYYTDPINAVDVQNQTIDDTNSVGQLLSPVPAGGQGYYQISSVSIRARSVGVTDGLILAELRVANPDGTPSDTVLGSATMRESSLTAAYDWVELDFSHSDAVKSGSQVCLILSGDSGIGTMCEVSFDNNAPDTNSSFCMLTNSGAGQSWQSNTQQSLLIEVMAIPVASVATYEVKQEHLTAIQLKLSTSGDETEPVSSTIRLLQAPSQVEAYWESYYEANPSKMTIDTNGQPGWASKGQADPTGALIYGDWALVSSNFDANTLPNQDVISVDLQMRAITGDGPWVLLPVTVDSDGLVLPLWINVRQNGIDGHELVLYNSNVAWFLDEVINISTLEWVDVSLTLLPDEELIWVTINNRPAGSYRLDRKINFGTSGWYDLYDLDANVGAASIRMSIGGTYSLTTE